MSMSIAMQNNAQISHILGVDFGSSKIGLAVADQETKMAFALTVLANDKNLMHNLAEIIKDKNVQMIVMGMTSHEKDEKSAEEKLAFAKLLEDAFEIKVAFQEEMFSTKIAQGNIKLHGKKKLAATDDQEAARIILQEWLDNQSNR